VSWALALTAASVNDLLASLLLGLIQGLSEFLPISSSGHLVLAQTLMGVPEKGILREVVLHAGTLGAVLWVFRADLRHIVADSWGALRGWPQEGWGAWRRAREGGLLLWATLPAACVGLGWSDEVKLAFERPTLAALLLVVTGLFLLGSRWAPGRARSIGWGIALLMGLAQTISLLPGISRSGATITAGLFAGARPSRAARFSFLMSVPAILGSVAVSLPDFMRAADGAVWFGLAVGFATAFLSGWAAIHLLLRAVERGRFFLFGIYCIGIGVLSWLWLTA